MKPLEKLRFMGEHRWAHRHMSDHIDGDSPASERIDAHVSRCPQCRELLRTLRQTVIALGQMPGAKSTDIAEQVLLRWRRET